MPQRWPDQNGAEPLRRKRSITRENATGIRQPWEQHTPWSPEDSGVDRSGGLTRTFDRSEARRMVDRVGRAERVAWHESGHALVAWRVGLPVANINIDLDTDRGVTNVGADVVGPTAEDWVAMIEAGVLAEKLSGFPSEMDGGSSDREQARDLSTLLNEGGRVAARDKAENLVAQGIPAIRALANVLIRRRSVTGAEAVAVLAEHWTPDGPPPPLDNNDFTLASAVSRTGGRSRADMTDHERRVMYPHLYESRSRDFEWQATHS